jgi:hypothetical protein
VKLWAVPLLAAWLLAGWIEGTGSLEVRDASITRLAGPEVPIRLPFAADAVSHGQYRVKGRVRRAAGNKGARLHLSADDCVDAVSLDGKPVDLSRYSRNELCDWRKGIDLAPANQVPETGADLEAVITNLGGPYSFELTGPFETRDFTIQRLESPALPMLLPFLDTSDPSAARYLVRGTIEFGRLSHRSARVIADDCLLSLSVHGKPVDLSGFSAERLCDWNKGVTLNFSEQLELGPNSFEATFRNNGGNFAFRVDPDLSPFARMARVAQLLIALGLAMLWWPKRRMEGAIFALGAMLRLDFIFSLHRPEIHAFSDAAGYLGNAIEMASGIFSSHQLFQGVGYPLLISWSLRLAHHQYWLIHWVQWGVSVLSVLLAWKASERLLGRKCAAWALVLLSFHFPFISLSGFFMAETLYTLFVAALFYLMARFPFPWSTRTAATLGGIFMLGHSVKGLGAFFAPISFIWAAVWAWKRGARTPGALVRALIRPLGGFCAGIFLVAGLQAVYTRSLWGHVVLSAPTGGLNLVEGKCPWKINKDSEGYGWQSPLFAQLGESRERTWPRPFSDQAFFWRAGFQCILDNPVVLLTSFEYVHYLFADNQLWPSNQTYPKLTRHYGMFYTALLCPGILLGLLLLLRRPFHRGRLPFLLAAAILFGSWALKSEMRYRIPFDVVFLPLSVLGWSWLASKMSLGRAGARTLAGFATGLGLWVVLSIYMRGGV